MDKKNSQKKTSLNKKIFKPIFFLSIEEEKHMSLKNDSDKKTFEPIIFCFTKGTFLQKKIGHRKCKTYFSESKTQIIEQKL